MAAKMKDLTETQFKNWFVIELDKSWVKKDHKWICRCKCGVVKSVYGFMLKNGNSKSCGCLRDELAKKRATTHGMTKTREHRSWGSMIQRCENPNHIAFNNYGGRGIKVCKEWRESFDVFLSDMGFRPQGETIDRIDTNGDYCKENCRRADESQQKNNRRDNKIIEHNGISYTLSNLARKYQLTYNILQKRIASGMDIDRALAMPIRKTNRYHDPVTSISKS